MNRKQIKKFVEAINETMQDAEEHYFPEYPSGDVDISAADQQRRNAKGYTHLLIYSGIRADISGRTTLTEEQYTDIARNVTDELVRAEAYKQAGLDAMPDDMKTSVKGSVDKNTDKLVKEILLGLTKQFTDFYDEMYNDRPMGF